MKKETNKIDETKKEIKVEETKKEGIKVKIVANILKDGVNTIKPLITEGKMRFKAEGLEVVAMDTANVSMVIFKMPKSSFYEYAENEKELGINFDTFHTFLKRFKDEVLEITEKDNRVTIKGGKKTFVMPLLDIEEKEQKIPELKFTTEISINKKDFSSAIEDSAVVGESILFVADGGFKVLSEGDLSKAEVDFGIVANGKSKGKYSIEYLSKMMNIDTENLSLKFSNDYPLSVSGITKSFSVEYILAPRVDNE